MKTSPLSMKLLNFLFVFLFGSFVFSAPPATVKIMEEFLSPKKIKEIVNAKIMPLVPNLTGGVDFEVAGVRFVESDLATVAVTLAERGDWYQASIWTECLESSQTHMRFIAYRALIEVYGIQYNRAKGFNWRLDPTSSEAGIERLEFGKVLKRAKERIQAAKDVVTE